MVLDQEPTDGESPEALILHPGIVFRRGKDFAGRALELHALLSALQQSAGAGVILHGIGGVGKSALAARVLHELNAMKGLLVASISGPVGTESSLVEIARALRAHGLRAGRSDSAVLEQLGQVLRNPSIPWQHRLELLTANLPDSHHLLLLFDDFDANLSPTWTIQDDVLARFLSASVARAISSGGRLKLFITCRHPVRLPERAEANLLVSHLGPLPPADTHQLVERLRGLEGLDTDEKSRALTIIGGHPRALEYLDAMVAGQARFPDVEARLSRTRAALGFSVPDGATHSAGSRLDDLIQDTLALMAADVDLDALAARLDEIPQARALLMGTSVYRRPVDEPGLVWQFHGPSDSPGDKSIAAPLLRPPEGWQAAFRALVDTGLLSPGWPDGDDSRRFIVHRWIASILAAQMTPKDLEVAHQRAARYWEWCMERAAGDSTRQRAARLEAQFHHRQALKHRGAGTRGVPGNGNG